MSKRIGLATKEYLTNAPLPQQTASYTVIPHGAVMSETEKLLKEKGFIIEKEMYKCTENAQVAQGVYHLKYGADPEMSMLVAWNNSYDKSMRFKFAVGGYIHNSGSAMLSKTIGNWNRKHTGTADQETERTIREQLDDADKHYSQLVADKTAMKDILLNNKQKAEFLGRLYLEKNILNTEQLSLIKAQLKQPSFDYNADVDSLWVLYNHVAYALQRAHPKAWMDQQRLIHYFIDQEFNLTQPENKVEESMSVVETKEVVPANQLDIHTVIAEIEQEALATPEPEPNEAIETVVEFEERSQELMTSEPVILNFSTPEADLHRAVDTSEEAEETIVDDSVWNCLDCGEAQTADAIFYDGQLCGRCHSKQNSL